MKYTLHWDDSLIQVYISSSFEDLRKEREIVSHAIRRCGHMPVGMEDYNASDQTPLDYCLADVRTCGLYIGICAWRYGFLLEQEDKSITQLEYEEACLRGIPRLVFLLREDACWPVNLADENRTRVKAWRRQLERERLVGYFSTPAELFRKAIAAIARYERTAAEQQQRPPSEIPPLLPFLCDRSRQELKLGQAVRQSSPYPLVCLVPGEESQGHDMFLRRVKEVSLPRLLDLETAVTLYPMAWPPRFQGMSELHQMLSDDLASNVRGKLVSMTDVNSDLARIPGPVLIHTHVLTENWLKHENQILEGFLQFWQRWPPLAPGQRLFVFLFIQYQIQREQGFFVRRRLRALNQTISKDLEEINFARFDRINGAVLPELEGVTRIDAENWARSRQVTEFCSGEEEGLVEEVRQLFERPELAMTVNSIPMNTFARELKRILSRYGRPRESFA